MQKCPECGSTYLRLNAFHDIAPFEEQYQYTCGDCQEQFNPTPEPSIGVGGKLKSSPFLTGRIVSVLIGDPENVKEKYRILWDDKQYGSSRWLNSSTFEIID